MGEIGTQSVCAALWRGLVNLVFPAHCALCGAPLPPSRAICLCGPCWEALPSVRQPYCPRCGREIAGGTLVPFDTPCGECRLEEPQYGICRAAGRYEGSLRECVHLMKFRDRRELSAAMGLFMAEWLAREIPGSAYDALVPVPIAPERIVDFVEFDPGNAIKFTITRLRPSGSPGDPDIFGAQQYAPLLDVEVPVG